AQTVPPRTGQEQVLHRIWLELLGLDSVGVTDSFFHVGGDSIMAIRMAARAAEAGLSLTPTDIFQLQTIERLARAATPDTAPQRHDAAGRTFPGELLPMADAADADRPFLLASLVPDRPLDVVDLAL